MEISSSVVDFNRSLLANLERGERFAIATILRAEGSAPRQAGVKAIIDAEGRIQGTIGGGKVEAEATRYAVESIKTGRSQIFDFQLHGAALESGEPICGGFMRVLLDPGPSRHRAAFEAAGAALARRESGVLITTIGDSAESGIGIEFFAENSTPDCFPGEVLIRSIRNGGAAGWFVREATPENPRMEALVEPLHPKPRLVIAGGGHVGQAVAVQADLSGFDVVVVEDRPEYADARLFPGHAAIHCGAWSKTIDGIAFDANTYVVIVTRGHAQDAEVLAACMSKPAAYVGMIGSRRKVAILRREFVETGRITEAEFERVCAPIGLDIGAVTVPEIAVSIMAQLISVRRRGLARDNAIKP